MSRAPQQRRIATHSRLIAAAKEIVAGSSFADMRVEEVVLKAGVAKGTFFAHFKDKDALMEDLIGADLEAAIAAMRAAPAPQDVNGFTQALAPLSAVMGKERVVFDVILRRSGALADQDFGPIAQNFVDQIMLMAEWIAPLQGRTLRDDTDAALLAEGVQAFVVQTIAMSFCAVESAVPSPDRLQAYLTPWLGLPPLR